MKFAIVSCVALIPAILWAGDSLPSDLRLLDLNVVALDNHGQPVTDLTADDFQITDGGKLQKISFFRRVSEERHNHLPVAGPNEFSNRAKDTTRNATVVLFDILNMGFSERGIAAEQLVKALGRVERADSLYLYMSTVDGKLFALRGISPESMGVGSAGPSWTSQAKPMVDQAIKTLTHFRSPDIDVFVRTELTFKLLETLGAELATVPGKKTIVWVTDGVPIALGNRRSDTGVPVDFTPMIRGLSEALERSDIALYPVRQLMLGREDDIGTASGGIGGTGGGGTGVASLATLNLFADITGGRRNAGKDIGSAIQQAMTDSQFYYQLAYYAPAENWNDKFHKVRVISTKRGVRIQAETGYYAWKTEAGARKQDAFRAAASTPYDAEEIGLRATVSADPGDNESSVVKLRIQARDVALAQEGDRYTGHLGIMIVGYLPTGLAESTPMSPLDINYTAAQREQALKDGIEFAQTRRRIGVICDIA